MCGSTCDFFFVEWFHRNILRFKTWQPGCRLTPPGRFDEMCRFSSVTGRGSACEWIAVAWDSGGERGRTATWHPAHRVHGHSVTRSPSHRASRDFASLCKGRTNSRAHTAAPRSTGIMGRCGGDAGTLRVRRFGVSGSKWGVCVEAICSEATPAELVHPPASSIRVSAALDGRVYSRLGRDLQRPEARIERSAFRRRSPSDAHQID